MNMVFLIGSPIVGVPIFVILSGCKPYLIFNTGYMGCKSVVLGNLVLSLCVIGSIYYYYKLAQDSTGFSYFDLLPEMLVALLWLHTVSLPYAFYTNDHLDLLSKLKLSGKLLRCDSILWSIFDKDPDLMAPRIESAYNEMQMEPR